MIFWRRWNKWYTFTVSVIIFGYIYNPKVNQSLEDYVFNELPTSRFRETHRQTYKSAKSTFLFYHLSMKGEPQLDIYQSEVKWNGRSKLNWIALFLPKWHVGFCFMQVNAILSSLVNCEMIFLRPSIVPSDFDARTTGRD